MSEATMETRQRRTFAEVVAAVCRDLMLPVPPAGALREDDANWANDPKFRIVGRCSGIPECCVLFWIDAQPRFRRDDPVMVAHWSQVPKGLGYIPCPACLEARAWRRVRGCPTAQPCPCVQRAG